MKSKPIYVGTAPNGRLQVICYTEKQVNTVHEIFTGKGNYPVDYEEWDEGKDKKYIITYSIRKREEVALS
tara:strand:- start:974 stop:1183 length:210 start_codon:yes stop_codon:yes gene_type:complete